MDDHHLKESGGFEAQKCYRVSRQFVGYDAQYKCKKLINNKSNDFPLKNYPTNE